MGFSSQTVALFPADNAQDDTEPTRFKPIKNPQFFTSPTPPPSPGPFPTQPSLTQPSPTHPSPSDARPRRDLALTFTNTTLKNINKYLNNQGNYKISDFKGMSYNDIRPIFEKIWDFNQNIKPMDAEQGSKKQKSPEKERSTEKIVEEEAVTQEEREEVVKEPGAKRKKSIPRKSTRKRQKMEEDSEKDELNGFLDIVPREEAPIEVESISTKFPIVEFENIMCFDRDLHVLSSIQRLVKNRYSASSPEGFDLMLWGDLHTLFEPDKDDEIWRDQHEYNLLSWRFCEFLGIHHLLYQWIGQS
ncbi:hypothetical protein Tco_0527804 [Tanacetum coccineum]